MQLRISLGLILLATSTTLVGAAPTRSQIAKRDVKCPSADKNGASFTSSSTAEESGNLFAVCSYGSSSSDCTYFTDGSFSSGGSSCPKGLVQDGSFAAGQGTGGGSGGSSSGNTQQQQQQPAQQPSQQQEKPQQQPTQQQTQQQTSGSIDPSIECPAKDDDGTPLIASNPTKDQAGNEFAECTYQGAGPCTYFFADGSFSSGSSQCPQGQAQDGNGGGGQQQQTPPQTSTPPPPPPPQTTSTPPPPPPPTTSAPPPPPPTTTPPPPPPPASTPAATSTQVAFTTVVVPPPEESGTSNNVPGQQGGLGAGVQLRPGMGMVLTVVPVVWVLFGL